MVPVEIMVVYVAMGVAIIGGLLLVWCLLEELVQFDSRAHRPRSARIPGVSAGLTDVDQPMGQVVAMTPRPAREGDRASGGHRVSRAAR